MKWIKNLFRKKESDFPNVYHPDFVDKVEEAFKAGSVQYYRFKQEIDMPYGRYKEVSAFLQQVNLRMNLTTLRAYIAEIRAEIDGSKGSINCGKAYISLSNMESRTKLLFEPESAKNLASVVYFDDKERLNEFDNVYAAEKIKHWEQEGSYDFFLTRPMKELLGLSDTSPDILIAYIQEATDLLKELTPATTAQ